MPDTLFDPPVPHLGEQNGRYVAPDPWMYCLRRHAIWEDDYWVLPNLHRLLTGDCLPIKPSMPPEADRAYGLIAAYARRQHRHLWFVISGQPVEMQCGLKD